MGGAAPFVSAGASLLGSAMSSGAAGDAASAQAGAAQQGIQLQKQMYDQTRADLSPYRDTGYSANNTLAYLMGLPVSDSTIRNGIMNQYSTGSGSSGGGGYNATLLPYKPKITTTDARGRTRTKTANYYEFMDPLGNVMKDALGANVHFSGKLPKSNSGINISASWLASKTGQNIVDNKGLDEAVNTAKQGLDKLGGAGSLAKAFGMEDYQADPGYQFRLQQGQQALDRGQLARGNFLSGGAMKALNDYNSGMASQEYGNAYARFNTDKNNLYSRLAGLSNQGMGATNNTAQAGQNYANQGADLYGAIGSAKAAGSIAQGNAWNQGLAGIMGSSFMQPNSGGNVFGAGWHDPGYQYQTPIIWNK